MLGSAMHQEASWSRSNFSWGTFLCKRPNATLAASSGFDQPSMIALASSRIRELVRGCGRVADHTSRSCLSARPRCGPAEFVVSEGRRLSQTIALKLNVHPVGAVDEIILADGNQR